MKEFKSKDFLLTEEEVFEIKSKKNQVSQISYAVLFKIFQHYKRFSYKNDNTLEKISDIIKKQLEIKKNTKFDWNNSSIKRFKREIRELFKVKVFAKNDKLDFIEYFKEFIYPRAMTFDQTEASCIAYFDYHKLERLSSSQQTRLLKTIHTSCENHFFKQIEECLSSETKNKLDHLLFDKDSNDKQILLADLKQDKVYMNKDSIFYEIERYKLLKSFNLPESLGFKGFDALFRTYADRLCVESPSHIKEHHSSKRYSLLACFCLIKRQKIIDNLCDILIKLVDRLQRRAEKKINDYILSEVKRVGGKFDTLLLMSEISLSHPSGLIKENIYKAIPQEKLQAIVHDLRHKDKWFKNEMKSKALSLYKYGNSAILWSILNVLPLKADQEKYKDILKALDFIKNPDESLQDNIPYAHIFNKGWMPFIKTVDKKNNDVMNKKAYELALFEALSEELSVKNIWAKGAYRYRNPCEDLPSDFEDNKAFYFDRLNLSENADDFIKQLKSDLTKNLKEFNKCIVQNENITTENRKNKGFIKVKPYSPQEEPQNLHRLQKKLMDKWGATSLMDILKEADNQVDFTEHLKSVSSSERIEEGALKRRKLLCLFSLGTNTGLKSIASGQPDYTLSDLYYTKLRYIDIYNVREAIRKIVNRTIKIRDPKIWGEASTGCACDSKKISVWDQNLLSEWHIRYGGKGVMVYWHVDKKALVVYSQLKTCSFSEVGSMMKGVLEHDSIMEMDKIYTDTHGQSAIGFALSHLLGFNLLPRLKNIGVQKLYKASKRDVYENLEDIMPATAINWSKIKKHYHEIVHYAAALQNKCVDPSVLLKRLSYDNKDHPLFIALLELGKAVRTIFLCRYLKEEQLRIEIQESLNIVERVNSIMGFIFYGKRGEISSNNTDTQELSILSLHLLQVCMVYINTLMIQEVLQMNDLNLTKEDLRGLSPLIHFHITPYERFILNMDTRIPFQPIANENRDAPSKNTRSGKSQTIRRVAA